MGSSTQDGDTDVQVWSETPFTDSYLIGGNSNSADFTENEVCASNGKGCAYLANWNKITQDFTQKWIFTKPTTIKDIKFASLDNSQQDYTFAMVFEEEGKNSTNVNDAKTIYRNVVTFNKWDGKKADLSSIAYTMMTPLDSDV